MILSCTHVPISLVWPVTTMKPAAKKKAHDCLQLVSIQVTLTCSANSKFFFLVIRKKQLKPVSPGPTIHNILPKAQSLIACFINCMKHFGSEISYK